MARRGYLQRIAAPLIPGEPVLFAVPGAAAEDARPAAPARPAGTPTGPATVVRRKQAALAQTAAANKKPAPPGEPGTAPAAAPQTPARRMDAPEDWPAPPPAGAAEPGLKIPPASPPLAAFGLAPMPQSTAPDAGPAALTPQATPAAGWPAERFPTPAARRFAPPLPEENPAWAAPRLAGPRLAGPRSAQPQAEPPRIHIGTIEIRTATPPPAAVAPPPATTAAPAIAPRAASPSPQRGYAWRFGLIQG